MLFTQEHVFLSSGQTVLFNNLIMLLSSITHLKRLIYLIMSDRPNVIVCFHALPHSIPVVAKAKSGLASWVRKYSGYRIMSLYHMLAGAAGEETSGKGLRD